MEEGTYQATQDLVLSLVNHGMIDIRVWMRGNDYEGFIKRGIRFYHFHDNWPEFEMLMDKGDKLGGEDSLIEKGRVASVLLRLRIGVNNADSGVFGLPPKKEEMFSHGGFA